jgi:hypothetical protein
MLTSTILVQEPDYVGFRKIDLPLRAEGVVYDGADPYATPLGVIFLVAVASAGNGQPQEIYVPREWREEGGKIVYSHDLDRARYVMERNGFEESQLRLDETAPVESARKVLRAFFEALNMHSAKSRYRLEVRG